MAGLSLYTSNRLEILANQLAEIVQTPLPTPFTPEVIVVQSRGMERWIAMELARLNGVSANCDFPFPNAFLEDIFKNLIPDMPETSPFEPDIMTFRLMRIIAKCINRKGFEDLNAYLAEDGQHLKLYQLSGRIADLFDQYLVFRPQLLFQWERSKEKKAPPHNWQAQLWRELAQGKAHLHRARMRENLLEQIRSSHFDPARLPKRISLFGISHLPLFHLQAFAELSRLVEVNFFLIDPCREYWADIISDREIKKIRRKYPQVAENIEWYHFEKGNRLLAAMGNLGRDFFKLISDLDCEIFERFEEPREFSVLACLQSDILNLRDRESNIVDVSYGSPSDKGQPSESQPEIFQISSHDTSVQVHSCHSPMREIEVLHDNLLAMFEEEPDLLPKDIIVMTPDIETYAPYVHAVFDAQIDVSLRMPYSIADQSPRAESRMIEGFLALLDITDSRFEAVQVMSLLEFPGIKERFGLAESDLKIIERWIKDTRIRWGIDSNSRGDAGVPAFSENTWRAGLERLMLGYAMPGQNRKMFNDILPYDHVEGADAQILGNLFNFIDHLIAWSKRLNRPRKLSNWQETLTALVDRFFKPDEKEERELQILRNLLDDLTDIETTADHHDEIAPEVVRAHLKSGLEQNRYGSGFLTGGITFCAMLPMRSIPFKVICLVGMNNDAYPRNYQPLNFDLMAQHPQAGDRSRRNDDKYLFLESIISARKKLYISYVGQSVLDNSILPPCMLVSELLDTIKKSFAGSDKNILEKIVTRHRLQPFSTRYFREDTGLFSYSTENMLAAASEKAELRPFVTAKIPWPPEEADEWQILDLDSLCRFFNHPARFFIQRRLGITLEGEGPLSDVRENFVLIALEKYLVEQNLLKNRLAGSTFEDFKPVQKALGQLPHGRVGDFHYNEMNIEVENFISKIESFTSAAPKDPIEIGLNISGFNLRGRLSKISESGYVHVRYARKRVKDILNSWIYHLVFCLEAPPEYHQTSFLICKDSALEFDPVPESRRFLKELIGLFRRGWEEPIHFFPDASYEYAKHRLQNAGSDQSALNKAGKKWQGGDSAKRYAKAESEDPYYDLCFRHLDPLDDEFAKIAMKVFTPLIAHSKEIIL